MTRPNVVWITLESVRADHTSLHGYDRASTPTLERIAERDGATSFDRCFSPGIWTLPVTASIFTGTYPQHHRATERRTIPRETPTIAELLSAAGYRTCCVSPNPHVSPGTDLDRGFDTFSWLSSRTIWREAGPWTLLKFLANLRRHSVGFETEPVKHNTSFVQTEILERWIDDAADDEQPFFCYAHYGDPHHPYYPPLAYRDEYAADLPAGVSPAEAADRAFEVHERLHETIATGAVDDRLVATLAPLYDAEVCYTDELLGRLYDFVRARTDDTVFVVTADHGELFGEYGLLSHRLVTHDALTHVPMVVDGLDGVADAASDLVQPLDVGQTILEMVGCDTDTWQGVDLRSERRDATLTQRSEAIAAEHLADLRSYAPEYTNEWILEGDVTAYRTDDHKYVADADGDRAHLYELPDEETDRLQDRPDVADRLAESLAARLAAIGTASETRRGEYTDAMREQLSALGYRS